MLKRGDTVSVVGGVTSQQEGLRFNSSSGCVCSLAGAKNMHARTDVPQCERMVCFIQANLGYRYIHYL